MTNEEAIEFLKNMIDREAIGFVAPQGDGDVAIWQYHVEALHLAIAALERDRWISAITPPDTMRDVLVTAFWHEKWQTLVGWFDGKWHVTANDQVREGLSVMAWREKPLPEPPKEET